MCVDPEAGEMPRALAPCWVDGGKPGGSVDRRTQCRKQTQGKSSRSRERFGVARKHFTCRLDTIKILIGDKLLWGFDCIGRLPIDRRNIYRGSTSGHGGEDGGGGGGVWVPMLNPRSPSIILHTGCAKRDRCSIAEHLEGRRPSQGGGGTRAGGGGVFPMYRHGVTPRRRSRGGGSRLVGSREGGGNPPVPRPVAEGGGMGALRIECDSQVERKLK